MNTVTRIIIAIAALLTVGCAGELETFSIRPDCDEAHAEVIRDVMAAYCEAGACLDEAPGDRIVKGDIDLACSSNYEKYDREEGSAAFTGTLLLNEGADIRFDAERGMPFDDLGVFWVVVAHEVGHAFGIEHGPGIMAGRQTAPKAFELDDYILENL